ncbi:thioredoxin family protein [Pseudomonas sp. MMS21-TM103]|uniref:thioredoxin family protein n=1 Tax=Pseudomonas sp. MMS21 TM103 TaxID=2886506 RepID=UPI001EE152A5|nr:thioredoxin family protein [Pseudomonas sp. MMS21 TM103]MCG4454547.1 thioredoxin family protein [Pseudomonas sp. MMS21 TM103]
MALTPSTMMPLGTSAPDFTLPDPLSLEPVSLSAVQGEKATLVMFICNHCPFVKHVEDALLDLAREYMPQGLGVVAISANDAQSYPEDGPRMLAQKARDKNYPFHYLYDETQQVAKAYGAACTPDLFLFDENLHCIYRGRFDDSRPGSNIPVSGKDLRQALERHLTGRPVDIPQVPSIGCSIKWKADSESAGHG